MKKIKYVKRQGMLDPCLPWVRPGSCRIGVLVGWSVLCLLIGLHFWTQKRVIGASYHRFLVFPMGCRCSVSWWESSRSLWWWAGGTRIHGRFRAVCLFTISCRQRGGGERICQVCGGRSLDVPRRIPGGWCMSRVGMMVRRRHWGRLWCMMWQRMSGPCRWGDGTAGLQMADISQIASWDSPHSLHDNMAAGEAVSDRVLRTLCFAKTIHQLSFQSQL